MKLELKQKLLQKLGLLTEEEIVHEPVYKCVNDGMVCFNGMVAEMVNGYKYEPEDRRAEIEDREYGDQLEQYMRDVRYDLLNQGLDADSDEFRDKLDDAWENFEMDYEYNDTERVVRDMLAEEICDDLGSIYHDSNTRNDIDTVHVALCDGLIDFDTAIAEVEAIITNQE